MLTGQVGPSSKVAGTPTYSFRLIGLCCVWIFFGSDIGTPRQPNLIHVSDDVLEQWTVGPIEKEGLKVNAKAPHKSQACGEAGAVQRGSGQSSTQTIGYFNSEG